MADMHWINKGIEKGKKDIDILKDKSSEALSQFIYSTKEDSHREGAIAVLRNRQIKAINRFSRSSTILACIMIGLALITGFFAYLQYNYVKEVEYHNRRNLVLSLENEFSYNSDKFKAIAEEEKYRTGELASQLQRFSTFAFQQAIVQGVITDEVLIKNLIGAYNVFEMSNNLFEKMNLLDVELEGGNPEYIINRRIEMYNKHKDNYDKNINSFQTTYTQLIEYLKMLKQ